METDSQQTAPASQTRPSRRSMRARAWLAALTFAAAPPALALDGDAIALVDGRPISRADLVNTLIDSHGLEVLQQLILLEAARGEAQAKGVKITRADVDLEFDRALDRLARESGMKPDESTRENKLRALETLLATRNRTMAEYMIAMERNAILRKLFEQNFTFDEATLREEFSRTYGERVAIRHIQITDMRKLNPILDRLKRGADFAEVARETSENPLSAARGGELDPFTFDDPDIPAAMRESAFALRPGELSNPIRTEQYIHVIKLERRLPPDNVRFEDVREVVAERLRGRAEEIEFPKQMERLYRKANVRVLDRRLKERYDAFQRLEQAGPAPRP